MDEMKVLYTRYLRVMKQILTRLEELCSNPTVEVWYEECAKASANLSTTPRLDELLILPSKHIEVYREFLRRLEFLGRFYGVIYVTQKASELRCNLIVY